MSLGTPATGLRRRRKSFVQLPSATIRDKRLSYRARGVLGWILDHPDGWDIRSEAIAAQGKEGREAIRTALHELGAHGYYRLERRRFPDGTCHMGTAVSEDPVPEWAAAYKEWDGKPIPVVQQADGSFKVQHRDGSLTDDGFEPPADDDEETEGSDEDEDPSDANVAAGETGDGFPGPGTGDGFSGAGKPGPGSPDAGQPDSGSPGPFNKRVTLDSEGSGTDRFAHSSGATSANAAATEQGTLPGVGQDAAAAQPPKDETLPQRAERVTRQWWDAMMLRPVDERTTQGYPGVKGIVTTALKNEHPETLVIAGLDQLLAEGRSISGGTLRIAMTELRKRGNGPRRRAGDVNTQWRDGTADAEWAEFAPTPRVASQ